MASRVACVVPARLGSTRFFGKLLTPLWGKPLIVHTLQRASGAGCFDRIVCLTDSPEIAAAAAEHGFEGILTGDAANGTERIARSLSHPLLSDSDLIVNLQGDEPAFPEEGLRTLAAALRGEPEAVHLLVHDEEPSSEDLMNPHRVKVAFQSCGAFAGFVRSVHAGARAEAYRLQLGAYGYSRDYLARYAALPPSAPELELSHEILRARDLAPLRAHPSRPGASVDVPEDLAAARAALEALVTHDNAPRPTRGTPDTPPKKTSEQEPQTTLQGTPA